jgi:hypothetical protein
MQRSLQAMHERRVALAAICFAAMLSACQTTQTLPQGDRGLATTARLDISPVRPQVIVGHTVQLHASAPTGFTRPTQPFRWDSADESIATVSGAGSEATVTGVAPGKVTISVVSANQLYGSVTVSVR